MNTTTMTIQDLAQALIREHAARFSTGVHGDEGIVLREVRLAMEDYLHSPDAVIREAAQSWARNDRLDEVTQDTQSCVLYMMETILDRTEPRRKKFTNASLAAIMERVYTALGCADHEDAKEEFFALANIIADREVIEVERGGEYWCRIVRLGLLPVLGPFLVEVERSVVVGDATKSGVGHL